MTMYPGSSMSPPTIPGPIEMGEAPSQWPKVIGVLAIVFGVLGAIGGLCAGLGALSTDILKKIMSMAPQQPGVDQTAQLDVAAQYQGLSLLNAFATVSIAVLLIFGGAQLLKRQSVSRTTLLVWAVVKIVAVVAGSVLAFVIQQKQMELAIQQMNAGSTTAPIPAAGIMKLIGAFGIGIAVLWGWALPVFLLIWLNRGKIKQEVAGWGQKDVGLPHGL